ncbi:hypothetical protein D9M71_559970 [compost metagenome]
MKFCSKCKSEKPNSEFNKNKSSKDGLQTYCRPCGILVCRKYYEDNADKERERKKIYRENNPEKVKEFTNNWRSANKDKVKKTYKKWCAENVEKRRVAAKAWNAANPGRKSATSKAWAKANPESTAASYRNLRAKRKNAEGKHTKEDILSILECQRGFCAFCKVKLHKSGKNKIM